VQKNSQLFGKCRHLWPKLKRNANISRFGGRSAQKLKKNFSK